MFIDVGPDPPIARGAYWLFMPFAMVLATPAIIDLVDYVGEAPTLTPPFQHVIDLYRIHVQSVAHEALTAIASIATTDPPPIWLSHLYPLSFAGALYFAAFWSSAAIRSMGVLAGFASMAALVILLGATLLGPLFAFISPVRTHDDDGKGDLPELLLPILTPVALAYLFFGLGIWAG